MSQDYQRGPEVTDTGWIGFTQAPRCRPGQLMLQASLRILTTQHICVLLSC